MQWLYCILGVTWVGRARRIIRIGPTDWNRSVYRLVGRSVEQSVNQSRNRRSKDERATEASSILWYNDSHRLGFRLRVNCFVNVFVNHPEKRDPQSDSLSYSGAFFPSPAHNPHNWGLWYQKYITKVLPPVIGRFKIIYLSSFVPATVFPVGRVLLLQMLVFLPLFRHLPDRLVVTCGRGKGMFTTQ